MFYLTTKTGRLFLFKRLIYAFVDYDTF
jgi:hypothetical protein